MNDWAHTHATSSLSHPSFDGHLGCFCNLNGYCKYCCSEHWGTCIFLNYIFLWENAQDWYCWVIWYFYFFLIFQGISMVFSIVAGPIYITIKSVSGFSFLHTLSSICLQIFWWWHSDWCEATKLQSSL